jgi:hypothetical protein
VSKHGPSGESTPSRTASLVAATLSELKHPQFNEDGLMKAEGAKNVHEVLSQLSPNVQGKKDSIDLSGAADAFASEDEIDQRLLRRTPEMRLPTGTEPPRSRSTAELDRGRSGPHVAVRPGTAATGVVAR